MDFQEFPKCLYLGGNIEAEYTVVLDETEEAVKREAGFSSPGESAEEEPKRKPGRPRKEAA